MITPAREADDDRGWRAMLAAGRADLASAWTTQRRLLLDAHEAYLTNPVAYAACETTANLSTGGGVVVRAADGRAQAAVDAFWFDAQNAMDGRLWSVAMQLSLFGEQFLRFWADPASGALAVRQLDPVAVEAVETDPGDVETTLRYFYRPPAPSAQFVQEGYWIAAGEVDHWKVNAVGNATRGTSDLATVLPWLARYKDWLVDRVRLNRLKTSFVYDVTINGARPEDLERLRREYEAYPPEPGSILFHGDGEAWKAVQPHVGADQVQADGRALRLMVATGVLMPEHVLLAEGGNANRATAQEMNLALSKRTKRRQAVIGLIARRCASRALDAAIAAGTLPAGIDRTVAVEFQDPAEDHKASTRAANVRDATEAISLAEASGWIDSAQAAALWGSLAGVAHRVVARAPAPAESVPAPAPAPGPPPEASP